MSRFLSHLVPAAFFTLLGAAAAWGQPAARQGSLQRDFQNGPGIGEPLPDAQGFDHEGKPFPLRSLQGQHAVIVFGCLT